MKYAALHRRCLPTALLSLITGWITADVSANAASADLFQARNGSAISPKSPVEWVKGNAGQANSHYVEGYSIPYRMVMTGLSIGPHTLILEWDTRQGGKHAIDYVTHYDRLRPHAQFGHNHTAPETINPLDDLPAHSDRPKDFSFRPRQPPAARPRACPPQVSSACPKTSVR